MAYGKCNSRQVGKVEVESVGAYLEQLELFFKANKVQDESIR